ncbi:MAG: DUF2147 domain-containing protein [Pseudolabrys sp.]
MQLRSFISRTFVALLFIAGSEASVANPVGLWRDKDGGTVRIHSCGHALCGTTVSVNPPIDPDTGRPRTDKNNVDASKRNRPVVGVQVLISMRPDGPRKWSGNLYDLDRGQIFSGSLLEIDAKTVRVEGCALGLCGGEDMTRVSR